MSEVYLLEPPTSAKVILTTTHGSLDVELWAKECPKACRNFLQLCVDGYYDQTAFHRVIKNFMIQGGDPTGTGEGGESIYGDSLPFPLEIHPRLKFRYRGLVALAVLEDDNLTFPSVGKPGARQRHGSQFFITLGRADVLNGKHTIFGKVTGHSLYNLLSIADVQVDPKTDRPLDPIPKIVSTEVLYSSFVDLHPRPGFEASNKQVTVEPVKGPETNRVGSRLRDTLLIKKSNLLSFEEDDIPITASPPVTETPTQCETMSHGDPSTQDDPSPSPNRMMDEKQQEQEQSHIRRLKERIACKERSSRRTDRDGKRHQLIVGDSDPASSDGGDDELSSSSGEESETELIKTKEQRKKNAEEMERLKTEILAFKKGEGTSRKDERESDRVQDADLLTETEKRRRLFMNKNRQPGKRKREQHTVAKIRDFEQRLRESFASCTKPCVSHTDHSSASQEEDGALHEEEEEDDAWLTGVGLKFAVDSARAYELDAAHNTLISIDPLANKSPQEIEERKMRKKARGSRC